MIPQVVSHSGVMITLGLLAGGAVVLTATGFLMARAGLSLRPVWWFGGFILLIVLPQLAFHVYDAARLARSEAPLRAALADLAGGNDAGDRALEQLFGPDYDPALVTDVRSSFGDAFAAAEVARFAVFPSGETTLLARFSSERAAEKSWVSYLALSGLQTLVEGDSHRGFAGSRPAGDRVYVLPMRTMLGVWTAPTDAAILSRMAAGGFLPPRGAPLVLGEPAESVSDELRVALVRGESSTIPLSILLPGLAALICIIVVYFFKGSAWAGTTRAADVEPISVEELRSRLIAINRLGVPFEVAASAGGEEIDITWRYGDANWLDTARAHGIRRVHRIVLKLDEGEHVVRATDYSASFDWSAGGAGAAFRWKAQTGITFFHYQHQRIVGVQLSPDGEPTGELSYSYTFNLQEMKSPLIVAVTEAGWDWRPVPWVNAPRWLHWLTN